MLDTLINKYLPDFTKVKISKEEAAEQLYQALCKQARAVGHDPAWEVSKPRPYPNDSTHTDEEKEGRESSALMVTYEAGPHDWGVSYSLGGYPKSYAWPSGNPNDWYLECYYGFDVMFSPLDHDNAPSFKSQYLKDGPSPNMRDKVDIVRI